MPRLTHVLAATLIAAMGCLAAVGPATALVTAADAASWTLAPVADEAGLRTGIDVVAETDDDISESIVLTNTGDEAADFIVQASDATNDRDGLLVLQPAVRRASEAGSWLVVTSDVIRLEAGAKVTIPVTIDFPPGAASGDHVAGIIAGYASEDGSIDLASAAASPIVWVTMRVAGIVDPTVAIAGATAGYHASWNPFAPGDLYIAYSVANGGNVALDVERTVIVSGPLGIELARFEQEPILSLLPGQYVDVTLQVPGVAPIGFTSTRIETVTSERGTVLVEEDAEDEPEPGATSTPTAAPTATPTPESTEDAEEGAAAPEPTETPAGGAAQTSLNYSATYPTASSSTIAVAISWTLLVLVVIAVLALVIARRAIVGTRERRYLMIDEALAARAAAAANSKASS